MLKRLRVIVLALSVSCLLAGATTASRLLALTADSPVADAAMRGDTAGVRTLLRGGADVNAAQGDGMTALHWTALENDLESMNVLLYAGAATEALTRVGGYTPLHHASSRGHAAAVARLLEAGGKVGPVTATGVQAVHLAAQAGNVAAVEALLKRGADINAKDKTHGRTPLIFAASQDRLDAVKLLLARGADAAVTTTVIDYQARAAADTQARQLRDKIASARTGRVVDSNFTPDPPAPGAAAPGQGVGAGRGAAPDPNDPNVAGRGGRGGGGPRPPSDLEQIGKQGGLTALHYAAREGFAAAALALVDAGLKIMRRRRVIDRPDDRRGRQRPVRPRLTLLLAHGANPNLANDDGVTTLFAALNNEWALRTWYPQPTAGAQQRASYLQLLEGLLKAGADPNARTLSHIWYASYNTGRMGVDFTGATPFWRAAYALDIDAMRLLVRYDADPNIPTVTFGAPQRDKDPSGLPAVHRRSHVPPCMPRAAWATAPPASRSSTGTCPTADAGGEVFPRGAWRQRQRPRRRRLHGAA